MVFFRARVIPVTTQACLHLHIKGLTERYKLRNDISVLEALGLNKLGPAHAMQVNGGVEVQCHSFLTSAIYGEERFASR